MNFLSYQSELREALLRERALRTPSSPRSARSPRAGRCTGAWSVRGSPNRRARVRASVAVVGVDRFREIVGGFWPKRHRARHYLRDVPGEFLHFFERNRDALTRAYVLPAYALDLARFEWAELETAYSFEETKARSRSARSTWTGMPCCLPPTASSNSPIRCIGWGPTVADETMQAAPFSLCLYRDAKTHEVAVLELTPVTAAMLT